MPQIVCKKTSKGLPCGYVSQTLRSWKRHMSAKHGGWDEDELSEVVGNTSSQPEAVKARMEQTAREIPLGTDGKPEIPVEFPTSEQVQASAQPIQPTEVIPPPPKEKRVKATPKKLQKILSEIPTKMLESSGMKLDDEDREAMQEAGEFLSDIFGVEFSVAESKYVVTNRGFAFLWVFGVVAAVWLKHNMPTLFKTIMDKGKEAKEKKDAAKNAQTPPAPAPPTSAN